jgi:murein DD-endopeptidase MepM/ murein hydrolase activator NlpD
VPTDLKRRRLRDGMLRQYQALALSLGMIFFVPAPRFAILLWAAIILEPRYAGFAIVGHSVGGGIGHALRIRDQSHLGGGLSANALLAALMVAWITGHAGLPLAVQIGLAIFSSASAAIVAAAIIRVLSTTPLPSLVWGYCVVSGILCCTLPSWALLAADAMAPWPALSSPIGWLLTFVRSLGSLLYSPSIAAGLVVGVSILLWSRMMLLAGLVGWLSGALIALAFTRLDIVYFWQPASYNAFLAGMALGSVFFLPGKKSLLIAAIGGCGASFLALGIQHLLQYSASAYLPIPAALAIWIGIGALTLIKDRGDLWMSPTPGVPPEEAWWSKAYWVRRFGLDEALLTVPLNEPVLITQGFEGASSHRGPRRHALDLRRPSATGGGDGSAPIWSAAVTAPAAGYVERVIDQVSDNALGASDLFDNWGNHVVIRLDQGAWVTLAHLQQDSISVAAGMRVEIGTYIGRVGNSGRSTTSHLHLQVQASPNPDSPTLPFRLANFVSVPDKNSRSPEWNAACVPRVGDIVAAASCQPMIYRVLASIIPGSGVWAVEVDGQVPSAFAIGDPNEVINITITREMQHRYRFETGDGDKLVCVVAPDAWRVIALDRRAPTLLELLASGAPSIPYAAVQDMHWQDPVPVVPASWWALMAAPYRRRQFAIANTTCLAVPSVGGEVIEVETRMHDRKGAAPHRIYCTFEYHRGPVKIRADFMRGSMTFSLRSFVPSEPIGV